jgi:hypothetical protein
LPHRTVAAIAIGRDPKEPEFVQLADDHLTRRPCNAPRANA